MLPGFNTPRPLVATLTLLGVLLGTLAVSTTPARAQFVDAPDEPDSGELALAYATVRGWLDDWSLPAPEARESQLHLRSARAVCIVLRRSGRVVGIGKDDTGDALMLRRAAGRAFGQALQDSVIREMTDTMPEAVGKGLFFEIELAGRTIPLVSATFEQLRFDVRPGLEGIALRLGPNWQFTFPSELRVTNSAGGLDLAMSGLLSDIGLRAKPLADLQRESGLAIYKFRTSHLVQQGPGGPPMATFRGDELVSIATINHLNVAAMIDEMVDHYARRVWPDDDVKSFGLRGPYRAMIDTYRPIIAPPVDQASAAWALARVSRMPHIPPATAARAGETAHRLLRQLARIDEEEINPLDDQMACAFLVMAGGFLQGEPLSGPVNDLLTRAEQRLVSSYRRGEGFRDPLRGADGQAARVDSVGQALLAFALATRLHLGATNPPAEVVREAIDAAWEAVAPEEYVSLLPWIGWAETAYADALKLDTLERRNELEAIRGLLLQSQANRITHPDEPDLHGGLLLRVRSATEATAHGLRPAAWLASVSKDARLVPDYAAAAERQRLSWLARFLRQLTVRRDTGWIIPTPDRAAGGVRAALWDFDQNNRDQVLGLLTAAEILGMLSPEGGR